VLVEDDEVHARIIEASLSGAGLANPVIRARTGVEAVRYLENLSGATSTETPVLVLLDVELPGQSGLAVLERLRSLGGVAGRCPVIMMSGSSEDSAIASARELGVSGYLIKPVAFDALIDVIHRLKMPWAILSDGGG
jgi:CheY-like chemotaxis protein